MAVKYEHLIRSLYKNGWEKVWKYFWILLLILLINFALSLFGSFLYFMSFIYSILVGVPLGYGFAFIMLKAARGIKPKIKDLFVAFNNYGNTLLAGLLSALIVIGGLILLIIPGIIFSLKLNFVPYLIVDKKMKAIPAIKKSWKMTEGYLWNIFLIYLLGIFVIIAGLICLIVGVIPASMMVSLANASLYHLIDKDSK